MSNTHDTSVQTGLRVPMNLQRHAEPAADDPLSGDFWGDDDAGAEAEHPATTEPDAEEHAQPQDQPADEGENPSEGDTEGAGDDAQPKRYLGKYETPEELENAHKALQAEYTRMRHGLPPKDPDLLNQLLGPQGQQQAPGQAPGYPGTYPQGPMQQQAWGQPQAQFTPQQMQVAQQQAQQQLQADAAQAPDPNAFWRDFSKDPQGTMNRYVQSQLQQLAQPYVQSIAAMNIRQKVADLRADSVNFPGFREMEGDIAAYLQANPWLAQNPGGIEQAYYAVRGINAQAAQGLANQAAQATQAQIAAGKQRAMVEGQHARQQQPIKPKDPDQEEADAIVAAARNRRRGRI